MKASEYKTLPKDVKQDHLQFLRSKVESAAQSVERNKKLLDQCRQWLAEADKEYASAVAALKKYEKQQ